MRLLGTSQRDAIGLLELMWEYTCDYTPAGDIGHYPNEDIALALGWQANPDELIIALVNAGWLDKCSTHRLVVHHWAEHAPDFIKKRLSRQKRVFAVPVQTSADIGGNGSHPCLPTKGRQALPNQAQPREGKPAGDAQKPTTPHDKKDPLPSLFSAAFNNGGTPKQQAAFAPCVDVALALGATPSLLLSCLKPRPDDPFVAVRQAGKNVGAMLTEFGKLLGVDCKIADAVGASFDTSVPDGYARQADLEVLRKKHAELLNELTNGDDSCLTTRG